MTLMTLILADKDVKISVNPPHPSGWLPARRKPGGTVGDRFISVPFITSQNLIRT